MNNKLLWWFVFCYLSFPCSFLLIWIAGDINVVTDTHLDDEGLICAVTYCQLPDVDRDGKFNAFNTYRDTIDYYDEYGDDIVIYTKEEVGESGIDNEQFIIELTAYEMDKEKL